MKIERKVYDAFNGELEARVEAFATALAQHAFTEGVPAPVEVPIVEFLAKNVEPLEVIDEEVPTEEPDFLKPLSPRQIRLQLLSMGISLTAVSDILDAYPEPQRSIAQVEWEYAVQYERNHFLVLALAEALSIGEFDLDVAWTEALRR